MRARQDTATRAPTAELDGRLPEPAEVRREIEIAGTPDDVWTAVTTPGAWLDDEAREADGTEGDRLEPGSEIAIRDADGERKGRVELAEPPSEDGDGRLVWWWWHGDGPATRVEVLVVATPGATRVAVTETLPGFPLPVLEAPATTAISRAPLSAAAWACRLRALASRASVRVVA